MHWADISAALLKKGYTHTRLAKDYKLDRSTISLVIKGKRTSHDIAYAIAEVTGIPTEKMWPGKYLTPPAYEKARQGHERGNLPVSVRPDNQLLAVNQ